MKNRAGFTIVELLIVIVVIAVLAAITIVTYNGIQQRSNNTSRIANVSNLARLIRAYKATYDAYPLTGGLVCGTTDSLCTNNASGQNTASNATLMTELRKVGSPPNGVQPAVQGGSGPLYGVQYIWESTGSLDGTPAPVRLEYWLDGSATKCGVQGVSSASISDAVTPSGGYTSNNGNATICWIRL